MIRVVVGKRVEFVPDRMARIITTLLGAKNHICDPEKVRVAIACAGRDVKAEVTQSIEMR